MTQRASARVGIVDMGIGNLFSVRNACRLADMPFSLVSRASDIAGVDALILPGVGAFGEAMCALRRLDLPGAITDFAQSGLPVMGVCLGQQLLFESSDEHGHHDGLGLMPGHVTRFPAEWRGGRLRVPHIGWSRVIKPPARTSWADSPLQSCSNGEFMYFVHSYYVVPDRQDDILSLTEYEGFTYCSGVRHGNVSATQFHPEKSGPAGIQLYRDFHDQIRRAAAHG